MADSHGRLLAIWRGTVDLGWPVAAQQALNTLMRTVDILVTGFFSPASVAAIGLADLYSRIPFRIGMGLGSGAIAISSQETGREAASIRDRAIAQALLVGALAGLPFVAIGLLVGGALIALLGADAEVARLGGQYLALIFGAAPMRIVGFVGANALQGTGDTRTPMYVNGGATVLNIVLTVTLGLGLWLVPPLGIVGVGIATAVSRTVEAVLVVAAIGSARTEAGLARPRGPTITRQLFAVAAPDVASGFTTELAKFPFNAILLLFGTEATAAYHIASRLYQQVTAPLYRAFRTVASIRVGNELGADRPAEARYVAGAVTALCLLVLGVVGVVLFVAAEPVATLFTRDPATVARAADFNRAYAVAIGFIAIYFPLSGALKGAGDTRTPFYAGLVGSYAFLLGASYLLAVTLGYGLVGVFAGIVLSYAARAVIAGAGFLWGDWAGLAARMLADRAAEGE